MQQALSRDINITAQDYSSSFAERATVKGEGIVKRFFAWCDTQEQYRMFWIGVALMAGIGTVLPLTLAAIVFLANNNFTLWIIACAVNVPILIVNLAAQPPKITLPTLFFAWFVDAIIIIYSVAVFFM